MLSGLICLAPGLAGADACRDAFVACAAKTGNVPECSSVSRSCAMGATGEQLDTRDGIVTLTTHFPIMIG